MAKLIISCNPSAYPCSMDIPVYGKLSEIIDATTIHTDMIVDPDDGGMIQMCKVETDTRTLPVELYLKNTDDGIKSMAILRNGYNTPETKYASNYVFYDKE